MLWLMFSLREINELQRKVDQTKLKNESLVAEKLLGDKALAKKDKRIRYLEEASIRQHQAATTKEEMLTVLRGHSQNLSESLTLASAQLDSSCRLINELTELSFGRKDSIKMLAIVVVRQRDSIIVLQKSISQLKQNLEAGSRSVRQPLFYARASDGKATVEAKRVVDFVAKFAIPPDVKNLKFRIENPGGAMLADDKHLITEYLPAPLTPMATLRNDISLSHKPRTVQVMYRPKDKVAKGEYALKIFDGKANVGSAMVKLE